jgi:hypothetical protein
MRATRRSVSWLVALTSFALAGCGGDSVGPSVEPGQVISARVGEQVRMKLQSIGPGEYVSPPTVSSSVVQFLDVRLVTPHVPAGVTQEFRFRAVKVGTAVIGFRHTMGGSTVESTVRVR